MHSPPSPPEAPPKSVFPHVFAAAFALAVLLLAARGLGLLSSNSGPMKPRVEALESSATPARAAGLEQQNQVFGWPPPARPSRGTLEPGEMAPTRSPLTEVELARVLIQAHRSLFDKDPSEQRLSTAWAHVALENGRGSELYCNNFGNIVAPEGMIPFYSFMSSERMRSRPGAKLGNWQNVRMRYRAYATPLDGATAYWSLIHDQYTQVLRFFDDGNGYLAGRMLAQGGYMTADPEPYANAVGSLQQEFLTKLRPTMRP